MNDTDPTAQLLLRIEALAALLFGVRCNVVLRREPAFHSRGDWQAWVTRAWLSESAVARGEGDTAVAALQQLAAKLAVESELWLGRVEAVTCAHADVLAFVHPPRYPAVESPAVEGNR